MTSNFDYQGAKAAGYSDEEIHSFLKSDKPKQPEYKPTNQKKASSFLENIMNNASNFYNNFSNPTGKQADEKPKETGINEKLLKKVPSFDAQAAMAAGYSPEEINSYLEENIPQKGMLEKGVRTAAQFGLGIAEGSAPGMAYDIAVSPLSSKEAQLVPYRENVMQNIERLLEQKQAGVWDEQDQNLYDDLVGQMNDPQKALQNVKTAPDIGIRGLAEGISGQDLHPEGTLEKAAHWMGFLKDPKNIAKSGLKPSEFIKAFAPSGKEMTKGLLAGSGLQLAEEGEYGPIGTIAAAVAGDLIGSGVSKSAKGVKNLVTKPKETLAKTFASFTSKDKIAQQKEIIEAFRESGIQADLGTITDNNLARWTQSRIAQSGLTGKALDDFKKELSSQIKGEYETLARSLGEAKYATSHEAGLFAKEAMQSIRESDLAETRALYKNSDKALKENAYVDSRKLSSAVESLENQLKPGQLKSAEQQSVLNALEKLKRDITDSTGKPIFADVKDLINSKLALNDIINYEVQGGSKQLLRGIVGELDRAIISHGKENARFGKSYVEANKKFSEHAKTFRNRSAQNLLKDNDPALIMNKMNSVHGIREIKGILSKTPEGYKIFDRIKRQKLDEVVGNNLIDSASQQVKLGTFSKLLDNKKNRELVREILGVNAFKKLEKLQKNVGRLSNSLNKFYNSSQSAVAATDAAIVYQGMKSVIDLLTGNPWPLIKVAGGVKGARKIGELISNPEFLRMVEDIIIAGEKNNKEALINSVMSVKPYILQAMETQNQL